MATRPVFFPGSGKGSWVRLEEADFEWHPGMSLAQKQRSIAAMQNAVAERHPGAKILEISSKSQVRQGRLLSGFELCLRDKFSWKIVSLAHTEP